MRVLYHGSFQKSIKKYNLISVFLALDKTKQGEEDIFIDK